MICWRWPLLQPCFLSICNYIHNSNVWLFWGIRARRIKAHKIHRDHSALGEGGDEGLFLTAYILMEYCANKKYVDFLKSCRGLQVTQLMTIPSWHKHFFQLTWLVLSHKFSQLWLSLDDPQLRHSLFNSAHPGCLRLQFVQKAIPPPPLHTHHIGKINTAGFEASSNWTIFTVVFAQKSRVLFLL